MMDLEENFKYCWMHGIRNINCGYLRQVGKTHLLKKIIRNFKKVNPDKTIILITISLSYFKQRYPDLIAENIVNIGLSLEDLNSNLIGQERNNILIFSDEIDNIEPRLAGLGFLECYVCGFYSENEIKYHFKHDQMNFNLPYDMVSEIPRLKLSKYEFINET